jgi:predicted metal-binding protein
MSGCTRAQTVAFRAPGKVAYLFGDITAADIAELANFATLYAQSSDGTFPDARVLGNLRTKAIARIPG